MKSIGKGNVIKFQNDCSKNFLQVCIIGLTNDKTSAAFNDACSRSSIAVDLLAGTCSADIDVESCSEFFKLSMS